MKNGKVIALDYKEKGEVTRFVRTKDGKILMDGKEIHSINESQENKSTTKDDFSTMTVDEGCDCSDWKLYNTTYEKLYVGYSDASRVASVISLTLGWYVSATLIAVQYIIAENLSNTYIVNKQYYMYNRNDYKYYKKNYAWSYEDGYNEGGAFDVDIYGPVLFHRLN